MEYVQMTLDDWVQMKQKLRQELIGVKQSFVRIGYALRKIDDQRLYENDGYIFHTNLVVEVTLQETGKCTAVSCLVLCHFVYRVVDGIQVQLLCLCCQSLLACAGTVFSGNTHFQILLGGVGNNFAQHLCKLCSVFCLFVSSLFPVQTDLRVALTERNTCHCQVHTDLGAFAVEVLTQTLDNLFVCALCYADNVLVSPCQILFFLLHELVCRRTAERT